MVQGPHPSGRVVSVRMPEEIIERLDTLCTRTGRSRGFYLKMAVTAMLPQLEDTTGNTSLRTSKKRALKTSFTASCLLDFLPSLTIKKNKSAICLHFYLYRHL